MDVQEHQNSWLLVTTNLSVSPQVLESFLK